MNRSRSFLSIELRCKCLHSLLPAISNSQQRNVQEINYLKKDMGYTQTIIPLNFPYNPGLQSTERGSQNTDWLIELVVFFSGQDKKLKRQKIMNKKLRIENR